MTMNRSQLWAFPLGCAMFLASSFVASPYTESQDLSCPVDHVCVDYQGTSIAIDPDQGPVQAIVVREDDLASRTFEGSSERHTATLGIWISNGDTYDLEGEQTVDKANPLYTEAELGDVFILTEVDNAN